MSRWGCVTNVVPSISTAPGKNVSPIRPKSMLEKRERKRACAKRTIRKRRRINQGIPCHRRRTSISVRAECVAYKIETGRERPFKIKEATDKIPLGGERTENKKTTTLLALSSLCESRVNDEGKKQTKILHRALLCLIDWLLIRPVSQILLFFLTNPIKSKQRWQHTRTHRKTAIINKKANGFILARAAGNS